MSLRLTRAGNRVDVVAELNALFHPRSTILAIAVDTDGNPATGGGPWGNLGVRSAGWDQLYEFTSGDTATNTILGSFPLPSARRWRVQAATAQAATNQVMNVAFRGPDEHAAYKLDYTNPSPYPPSGQGAWFEDDQAAALRSGDISRFGYTVDTKTLATGVNLLAPVGPGLHERVYTSAYTLPPGKGMTYTGIKGRGSGGSASAFAQVCNFLGKYQPYGIYIPPLAGPHGLQMEWHGSNQGIVAQINQPGMQKRFGDDLNRILVAPEARGPNGYGSDISERDLLDQYVWYLHNPADHFTYAIADDWAKEAAYSAGQTLVADPARVTFRTDPFLDAPTYGIRHDRAYWMSDIRGRQDGFIDSDLTSAGCGRPAVATTTGNGAGVDPVPWVSDYPVATGTAPAARAQTLTGTVGNVASLTLDVRRACLGRSFTYRITSDGPATIHLSDGRTIQLASGLNVGTAPG